MRHIFMTMVFTYSGYLKALRCTILFLLKYLRCAHIFVPHCISKKNHRYFKGYAVKVR